MPAMLDAAGIPDDFDPQGWAQATLDATVAAVSTDGVTVDARAVQGPPASVLLDAAKSADLLVVGSRGHGGFVGGLLGSVVSTAWLMPRVRSLSFRCTRPLRTPPMSRRAHVQLQLWAARGRDRIAACAQCSAHFRRLEKPDPCHAAGSLRAWAHPDLVPPRRSCTYA